MNIEVVLLHYLYMDQQIDYVDEDLVIVVDFDQTTVKIVNMIENNYVKEIFYKDKEVIDKGLDSVESNYYVIIVIENCNEIKEN